MQRFFSSEVGSGGSSRRTFKISVGANRPGFSTGTRLFLFTLAIGATIVLALGLFAIREAGAAPPRFLTLPFKTSTYYVTQLYWSGHRAIDMDPGGSAVNADIVSAAPGTAYVKRTTHYNDPGCSTRELQSGGYGLYVVVVHSNGYKTYYAHLASAMWGVNSGGHAVSKGQKIGVEGNTGCAFGKHLHFEVRNPSGSAVNPGDPRKSGTCGVTYPLWTTCPASRP